MSEFTRHGRTLLFAAIAVAVGTHYLSYAAEPSGTSASGTFTDARDGKRYKTAVVGGKTWMAENLNYQPKTGNSWCYDGDKSFCDKYGRLYDWKTATKACPAGWHLPSRREWDSLGAAVGGEMRLGEKYDEVDWHGAGKALKAKRGWIDPIGESGGDHGWAALPGGYRGYYDTVFCCANADGYWWTATENGNAHAYSRNMYYGNGYLSEKVFLNETGLSVRCVQGGGAAEEEISEKERELRNEESRRRIAERKAEKEEAATERHIEKNIGYFTDSRDGRKYRAVKIGGRTWMAENLNYRTPRGSWCYDDDTSNCGKYGRLYDWETAKRVCPSGWYLPSTREWISLILAAKGQSGCIMGMGWDGTALMAKSGWRRRPGKYGGKYTVTDEFGFSALPGGYRNSYKYFNFDRFYSDSAYYADIINKPDDDSRFAKADSSALWWTSTYTFKCGYADVYYFELEPGPYGMDDRTQNMGHGMSVRCILGDGGGERADSARSARERERMRAEREKRIKERERKINEAKKTEIEALQLAKPRIEKISAYFTDERDGQKYRTVIIGGKRWMAENLNYQPESGNSWCYNDSASYCGKYGRLYDWKTAKTVCPATWRLPTGRDWEYLDKAVGSAFDYGKLRAVSGWGWDDCGDISGNGTDDFGLSFLPGGGCDFKDSVLCGGAGKWSGWWVKKDSVSGKPYPGSDGYSYRHYINLRGTHPIDEHDAYSVRCLQDTSDGKPIRHEPKKAK
jgi:uncharacterized protein (TIGR02145 family)